MKKTLDEKLVEQFEDLKVQSPDCSKKKEYLYADYVELIALFSNESWVTAADVLDRLGDEGAMEEDGEVSVAENNDQQEAFVNRIFNVLDVRSVIFGNDYPFIYSHNQIMLKSKESISNKNKLYIYLLVSSNLALFSKVKQELTTDFEEISYSALLNFLPNHAIVKQFGKRSSYTGNAIEKIRNLANDLKVEIDENQITNIDEGNTQERGLDIIGWIPFNDNCANLITILGQCACGKNWAEKLHDTRRFRNYLKFFQLQPQHALFIPYALIGNGGDKKFYSSDEITDGTLMFERKRIIDFYKNPDEFDKLESKMVVDRCIDYLEDIV